MLYSFYIDSTHTKTSSVVTFQIAIFDLKFGDDFDWLLNLETSNENITASDCWRGLEFFCPAICTALVSVTERAQRLHHTPPLQKVLCASMPSW